MKNEFKKFIRKMLVRLPVFLSPTPNSVKIVVASDSSHFKSLCRLLKSINNYTKIQIIFYDLGLSQTELNKILEFKNIEIRKFIFDDFPPFVQNLKFFAWKPQIIKFESQGFRGILIYMDSGNLVEGNLRLLIKYIKKYHFVSTFSTGILKDYTSPVCLDKLAVSTSELNNRNLNGALIGFNANQLEIVKLLTEWSYVSLDQQTIAPYIPAGTLHRYDQSLLSILSYRSNLVKQILTKLSTKDFDVLIHQDVD
jgi:hypothetical protein